MNESLEISDRLARRPRKQTRDAVAAGVDSHTLDHKLVADGVEIENSSDYEGLGVSRSDWKRPEDQSLAKTQKSLKQLTLDKRTPGEPPPPSPRTGQKRSNTDLHPEESPRSQGRHDRNRATRPAAKMEPQIAREDFDPVAPGKMPYRVSSPTEQQRSKPAAHHSRIGPTANEAYSAQLPAHMSLANNKARRHARGSKSGNQLPSNHHQSTGSKASPASHAGRHTPRPGVLRASEPLGPQQLLLQPDSRPISEAQLAGEVKSIYAGLAMVETKCMHVDKAQAVAIKQAASGASRVLDDHWQALIALHRTLLHEHHDFFLASQHPAASMALQRLAAKYSMPARMWKHGIHSFLELLRQRLPESKEYMLAFIYLAYQMMALLYETVPSFLDTWIECLGDLARYRMAIEDEDMDDREHWAGVARTWYNKAASRNPTVGRLYHHLAILARPNIVQQLSLYCRALTVVQPFVSARESVETFYEPIFRRSAAYSGCEVEFVRAHGTIYRHRPEEEFFAAFKSFSNGLDELIIRQGSKFKDTGIFMAITNIASLLEYGAETSELRRLFDSQYKEVMKTRQPNIQQQILFTQSVTSSTASTDSTSPQSLSKSFVHACNLTFSTFRKVLQHRESPHVLSYIHILLAFLSCISSLDNASSHLYVASVLDSTPWQEVASFLNTLASSGEIVAPFDSGFQVNKGEDAEPLPEDHQMHGLAFAVRYYPKDWFVRDASDDEDPPHEPPSVTRARKERVLWLGNSLALNELCGLQHDPTEKVWSADVTTAATASLRGAPGSTQANQLIRNDAVHGLHQASSPVDVEMADAGEMGGGQPRASRTSEEKDSPEMEMIKEQKPQVGQQPSLTCEGNCQGDAPSSRAMALLAAEILQKYKIVVCDANLFLYQLDVFRVLVEQGDWDIVVPNSVILELKTLSQKKSPTAAHAREALGSIKLAITEEKRVRIISPANMDVTKQRLIQEQVAYGEQTITEEGMDDDEAQDIRDPEDILIGVARHQSDLSQHSDPSLGAEKAAVLLTEDRSVRLKAAAKGVAAIAASVVKRRARRESKSSQSVSS